MSVGYVSVIFTFSSLKISKNLHFTDKFFKLSKIYFMQTVGHILVAVIKLSLYIIICQIE